MNQIIIAWVTDLAEAFSYHIKTEQLRHYVTYIERLSLTDAELESLNRQLIQELDKFPSIAQIWSMGRSTTRTKNAVSPRWRTWEDREGRAWAQRLSGWQADVPTREDLERWKQEACSTEEGIRLFREAYVKAGGDLSKLPLTKSMAMRSRDVA